MSGSHSVLNSGFRHAKLAAVFAKLRRLAARDEELVELQEDEIRRLKKLPPRPPLKPSSLASGKGSSSAGS